MRKLIAILLTFIGATTCASAQVQRIPSAETIKKNMRVYQLELIRSGQLGWPEQLENASNEIKLTLQKEQMDRIRTDKDLLQIPLTGDQIRELEQEGHFRRKAPLNKQK